MSSAEMDRWKQKQVAMGNVKENPNYAKPGSEEARASAQ